LYVTRLICMWHDSFVCDTTHLRLIYMWHDSFTCDTTHSFATCLIHTWHDSFICDMGADGVVCSVDGMTQWLIDMCPKWHDHVTWLIHTKHDSFKRNMTHSYDMTHSYVTRLIGAGGVVCSVDKSLPWPIRMHSRQVKSRIECICMCHISVAAVCNLSECILQR